MYVCIVYSTFPSRGYGYSWTLKLPAKTLPRRPLAGDPPRSGTRYRVRRPPAQHSAVPLTLMVRTPRRFFPVSVQNASNQARAPNLFYLTCLCSFFSLLLHLSFTSVLPSPLQTETSAVVLQGASQSLLLAVETRLVPSLSS